ncbi:hypothetical protein SQ11_10445 [Nitrosospira sp. NpAV]|nr:hypothetical protein SQ11_10445 [Nitrosospira sp. NpAV]
MALFVIYMRTRKGLIKRLEQSSFTWHEPLDLYIYKEVLTGWPESKVFWEKRNGFSIGIAPLRKKRTRSFVQ